MPIYEEVTAPNADWGPILSKIRANPPGLIYMTDYIPGDLASFVKQFVTAPTQSLLYQQYGPAPFLINTALMAGLLVYCFRATALKNADPQPASREAATKATLEKSDEGGSA